MSNFDLPLGESKVEHDGKGQEVKWRFVSNHLNMMYVLASGLLMPPEGFGKKYYRDTLSLLPGWIPLFPEVLNESAIDQSCAEDSILLPCYAEIDLSALSGKVKVLRSGEWSDVMFPTEIYGNEDLMLVPAPLPTSFIREIVFRTKEDKQVCEKSVRALGNVPLIDFKTRALSTPYKKTSHGDWPVSVVGLQHREVPMDRPDSVGGMFAALYQLSNRDDLAIHAYRAAYEGVYSEELGAFSMISGVVGITREIEEDSTSGGSSGEMFWKLVYALADLKKSGTRISFKDEVLQLLESSSRSLESQAREASDRLINDLRTVTNFADKTLREMFDVHRKPLPRALLLFFMKDGLEDLLDTYSASSEGYEFVAAAILFGAAEGWLRQPLKFKCAADFNRVIPYFTARLSHALSHSGIELGLPPERPKSLRELLVDTTWNKTQKEAALHFARQCGLECIKTRIRLGKGDYKFVIDGAGLNILLDGDVKGVDTEVQYDGLMNSLADMVEIPDKVEREARKILKV